MTPDLNIPPTTDPITQRAYDLQKKVNQAIEDECRGASPMVWQSIAQQIVRRYLDERKWKFLWQTRILGTPQIVVTQYIPPTHTGDER